MTQKRKYKNPYHQTQSELAEWLALFARDHSTTQVAEALVERYPERSTGDPKADHRLAKEAICTVNPNDSRYNAEKWAKQYGLMQANYITELDKSHRQLESKALTVLNAAYDNFESTIPSLSPKEQISLVPKGLLTLNQAAKIVKSPPPLAEQENPDEDAEAKERAALLASIEQLKAERTNLKKALDMLREGKNFDEITAETSVDEDEMKNDLARQRVEEEVLGMYENGMEREEIQQRTNLVYAYIDSLIEVANNRRYYQFDLREDEKRTYRRRPPDLIQNGDGENVPADSNAPTTQP